eukprot:12646650-Heterocapsa_arctica.AAC.1
MLDPKVAKTVCFTCGKLRSDHATGRFFAKPAAVPPAPPGAVTGGKVDGATWAIRDAQGSTVDANGTSK